MSATSSNHAKILAIHEASQECVWLRSVTQHIHESRGISSGQELHSIWVPPAKLAPSSSLDANFAMRVVLKLAEALEISREILDLQNGATILSGSRRFSPVLDDIILSDSKVVELMPLRRFFKDDEKKHAEDGDKQKEIKEMTEQTNATLGKIAL
ncbi:hypothetical protein Tco_0185631 [Tanacetum coccineum]